jgi:hypothetical protein
MNQILLAFLIAITVAQVLVVLPPMAHWSVAKAQNTITPERNTSQEPTVKMIIKDNIATVVNTTTNETISIRNLTADTENMITTESKSPNNLTADTENMITTESLSSNSLTENAENTTTNLNLTEKFNTLQGK